MDLEAREIRRQFIHLAWPIVVQNFLFMLMFHIDTAMVGRLDEVSLAATGLIGPVRHTIMAVVMGVCIGTVATVARAVGERNFAKARSYAASAYVVGLVMGLAATIAIQIFSRQITGFFIDDAYVVREASDYLRMTFMFFVFGYFSMIGASIMRAKGDTKTPMIVSGIANILNVGGNYIMIFGKLGFPALGLYGAGISTAMCKVFEGAVITFLVFHRGGSVRLAWSTFRRVSTKRVGELLKVSIPASAEPFFVNTGFLVFTKIVATLGTFAMAANRIAITVEALSFMPSDAFSSACQTLVGHKMGERSPRGIELVVRRALMVSLTVMSTMGLLFLFIPGYLARIFTNDPTIASIAAICLMIGAIEQPFMGFCHIIKGTFQGTGDTRTPIYLGAAGVWVPRLILSYLLALHFKMGLTGIWIATTADWIVRAILYFIVYRRRQAHFYRTLGVKQDIPTPSAGLVQSG